MNIRHILIVFFSFFTFSTVTQAQANDSYIVLDSESGKVFLASHTEKKRPVASLTKIATAKLAVDWADITKTDLSTKFLVPHSATTLQSANPLQLQPGDALSMRDALYASLLGSDNIAAHSLANFVGYSLNQHRGKSGDNVASFVAEMNRLTMTLGMTNTTFINPHGLDSAQSAGTSTATDMALLSMASMQSEVIAFIVKQKSRKISVTRASGKTESFEIKNTNKLLGSKGVVGLKTGLTSAAGQCLATIVDKQPLVTTVDGKKHLRPRQLVIILLGSHNRFSKTSTLISEAWAAYDTWGENGFMVPKSGKGLLRLPLAKKPENSELPEQ